MITTSNLKEVLEYWGYVKNGNVYSRSFYDITCNISVDFDVQRISYPEDKGFVVNDHTTCNFEHPENFVVLECVSRLLDKGYRPEHLELERRWKLGRDEKGGKADICIHEPNGNDMLCIIECKTYPTEFNKEIDKITADGSQIFSYWQQERSTKWLVLYASNIVKGNIERYN